MWIVWRATPSHREGRYGDISIPAFVSLPKSGNGQSDYSYVTRVHSAVLYMIARRLPSSAKICSAMFIAHAHANVAVHDVSASAFHTFH